MLLVKHSQMAQRWQFCVELARITPRIWRTVEVDADISLHDFNLVVQAAFGNKYPDDDYDFYVNGKHFSERGLYEDSEPIRPEPVPLRSLLEGLIGDRFRYVRTYWTFDLELTGVFENVSSAPRCIEGEGAMPVDEFGGNREYGEFLSGQRDPSPSARDFYQKWAEEAKAGHWFHDFDLSAANEWLGDLRNYEW